MSLSGWLLLGGVVIVVILAAVAGRLLWLLYQRRSRRRDAQRDQQRRINDSIQVLARSVLSEQVGVGEASIRISVLLDALQVDEATREEFSAFYQLAATLDHLPTHENWLALEDRERRRLRQQLEQYEADFGDFVRDAARRLRGRHFGSGSQA